MLECRGNAIEENVVDHILRVHEMPPCLIALINEAAGPMRTWVPDHIDIESRIDMLDPTVLSEDSQPGTPSDYSCPDCGGVLRMITGAEPTHYRCQVGHAYSGHALLAKQIEKIEESLWAALRALEEHSKLTRNMLETARTRHLITMAGSLEQKLLEIEQHQKQIRELLLNPVPQAADS